MRSGKRIIIWLLAAVLLLPASACGAKEKRALRYADAENWAYFAQGQEKDADVFLICPTVDITSKTNALTMDENFKARFVNALDMERGIYDTGGRMFAPYYRQMSINAYRLPEKEREKARDIAYRDISAAFRWYLDHENNGRGIILAGFSQGAELCLELLKTYFSQETEEGRELYEQLIAVYAIGWMVGEDMVEQYPQIVPAQGEKDTGVVVSFDCEDGSVDGTIIIPAEGGAVSINPLNWRTDAAVADRTLNRGAVMGIGAEPIPGLCGGYIGPRGELVVTDVTPADYPPVLDIFPEGAYHLYDYMFFFTNLQENVVERTAAWYAQQEGEQAA